MSTCKLKFDDSKLGNYINSEELALITPQVKLAHELLKSKTGAGSDFLGWINLPNDYDREEYNRIKITAQKIRDNADVLIVIGIGGSYLGAKACIESLNSTFFNYLSPEDRKAPQIFFAGNSISSTYLIDLLENRNYTKLENVASDIIEKSYKELLKNNEIYAYSKNGKWGFINSNDIIVVEPNYDIVTEFNQYGYAGIKKDEKWGVVNKEGKIIVEPSYKIEWNEPDFISKYCKLNFGYGFEYYIQIWNYYRTSSCI